MPPLAIVRSHRGVCGVWIGCEAVLHINPENYAACENADCCATAIQHSTCVFHVSYLFPRKYTCTLRVCVCVCVHAARIRTLFILTVQIQQRHSLGSIGAHSSQQHAPVEMPFYTTCFVPFIAICSFADNLKQYNAQSAVHALICNEAKTKLLSVDRV